MNDLVVLSLIFGNLMYSFWHDQRHNVDSKVAIRSAFQGYASKHARSSQFQSTHMTPTGSMQPRLSQISERSRRMDDSSNRRMDDSSNRMNESSRRSRSRRHSGASRSSSAPATRRSSAPSSKRERPPDSWAVLNTNMSSRQQEDSQVEQAKGSSNLLRIPRHGHKPRERAPDSWGGMNLTRHEDDSDAEETDPSSELEQILEEGTKATRKSLLEPSNLPKASNRFEYANSRVRRVRESYASEVEKNDDSYSDEP